MKGIAVAGVRANSVATLELQLIADVARLQKDMRDMQRAVGSATGGMSGSFAGVGAAASKMAADAQRSAAGLGRLGVSAGQQRAAMQQLSFQIGDVATQFAMGTNPMMIFVQQGGQVVQAIGMMQGKATGLIGFLGGPWGAVIMGAVGMLGMMWSKLGDAASGMDNLKIASSNTSEVQSSLAGVFNMTTGAVNNQTPAVINLAKAHLMLAQARAQAGLAEARAKITEASKPAWYQYFSLTDKRGPEEFRRAVADASGATAALSGNLTGAIAKVQEMGKSGKMSAKEVGEWSARYGDLIQHTQNLEMATKGLESLTSKKLNPTFITAHKAAKAHAGGMSDAEKAAKALQKALAEMAKELDNDVLESMVAVNKRTAEAFKASGDNDWAAIFADARKETEAWLEPHSKLAAQQAAFNDEMARLKEIAGQIDLGDIFGRGGEALEGMNASMKRLEEATKSRNILLFEASKLDESDPKRKAQEAAAEKTYQTARLNGTIAFLGATKSLFREESAGAKAMEAAQKALMAVQLVKTGIDVAGGAARMFSFLGPFAFPAVAAMMAVMAGLGFKGGSGGAGYKPQTSEQLQASIGTGTVAGDVNAQSDSLANSLKIIAENTNRDLQFSNTQVNLLRTIADNIGTLVKQIGNELGLGGSGMFSTTNLGLGQTGSSGFLGLIGGGSTTRTLYDQGIQIAFQSIGDVVSSGIKAQVYNVIEQVKKSNGIFGIGGSTKTTYSTVTGDVNASIERQMQLVIGNLGQSIVGFANQLGIKAEQDVASLINQKALAPLQLSFKDMSGDEIEKALQAYFSSVADDLASVLGGFLGNSDGSSLADLQRAGEGLFETLTRVVNSITTVDTALKSINMPTVTSLFQSSAHVQSYGTSGAIAGSAINLADLFGGLDAMQSAVSSFADKFLTEAERMQPIIAAVRDEMTRLGASGVTTNEQFKSLVQGLDLSTASGQEMFASLLTVAPAFAKVTEYLGSLNGELGETTQTAAQLAEIAKQRRALEIDLMTAMGDTAGALAAQRADQLAALDESNRALQQQVWAVQDATAAEKALADARAAEAAAAEDMARRAAALAAQRRGLEIELMEATGDAAGALAAKRADELAGLDETLRTLQMQIWTAQDAAQAAKDLAEAQAAAASAAEQAAQEAAAQAEAALQRAKAVSDERHRLEIELMDALGDSAGALAARRLDELAALDESNRALQQQIWTAQDAAAAAAELARAQEEAAAAAARAQAEAEQAAVRAQEEAAQQAARVQSEAIALQIRLYQALGNTAAATALQREQEMAAADAANRSYLEAIYSAEDAAAAQRVLAEEQAAAAQTAREAAEAAASLAQKRRSLEIELMEATGDAAGALAARRADELAAMDPTLRALQQTVWAAQDAASALNDVATALDLTKARADLEIRLMEAQGDAIGALNARRAQELAATDASLQSLLNQIYAAEDAAKAAQALAEAQAAAAAAQAEAQRAAEASAEQAAAAARELADRRVRLEIDLLNATGETVAAVALQRQMELAALDGSLHALQQQVWAAQDAAAAQQAATDALNATIEAEKALAEQRGDLTIRLLEAEGRSVEALALQRQRELAAVDASLRPILQAIYNAEDAAKAQEVLAQALADQTAAAEAEAERLAQIAAKRADLEIALMEATGQGAAALAARRAIELAALDSTLQALQTQIWAAQDAARAQDDLAKAQADQAAAAAALAKATQDMTLRLLDAQGRSAEATALCRQIEMEATDASLRGMLAQVYAAEDAARALDAYNAALGRQQDLINTARNNLSAAYQRESGALGDTISKFAAFSTSLREFRETLTMGSGEGANAYRRAQMEWLKTSALAATGDAAALGGLAAVSKTFLDASRSNAGSLTQYQRDVALVARSVDQAVGASDAAVDYAQAQLDALKQSVSGLITIDESVLSVRDAIVALQAAMMGEVPGQPGSTGPAYTGGAGDTQTQAVVTQTTEDLRAEMAGLRADLNAALLAMKQDTGKVARILERVTADDSLRVSNESDTPLYTEVTA